MTAKKTLKKPRGKTKRRPILTPRERKALILDLLKSRKDAIILIKSKPKNKKLRRIKQWSRFATPQPRVPFEPGLCWGHGPESRQHGGARQRRR